MANLATSDLGDVWNSNGMQKLRKDFLAGIRPVECSSCWDEEAAGLVSYRQSFVEYRSLDRDIDYHDLTPASPQALDLKLSNVCNLKCRICGPVASSLWLQEEVAAKEHAPGSFIAQLVDQRLYYRSNKITHTAANVEAMRSWLPELRYLEFTGGEPMLSPENRELIDLISTDGQPEQVGILFNTNCTTIDDRILGQLDRFREVKVCLSIDDIGERFEYQRSPAQWDVVEQNLARYMEVAGPNWRLYAFCSVSVFNVWYLPEYLRWLERTDWPAPIEFVLNLVHYPRHFSVQVLPSAAKRSVRQRLESETLSDSTLRPASAQAVRQLLEFLDNSRPDDSSEWAAAIDEIVERDGIRGEHFARVFPEFLAALRRTGAWPG